MNTLPIHSSRPVPKALAWALMSALAGAPLPAAFAGDLDNQTAEVTAGDPVEAWTLVNGSKLAVRNAKTASIYADSGSEVVLTGATVTRPVGDSAHNYDAMQLFDGATLRANDSHLVNGGLLLNGGASAELVNSSIVVTAASLPSSRTRSVGVDLAPLAGGGAPDASARLDGTLVQVEDAPDLSQPFNSGLGVRMRYGRLDIVNGSRVIGANVAAFLFAGSAVGHVVLNVDNSTLQSGRGAAIHVMPGGEATYDISIANGSQLSSADGHLLRVRDEAGRPPTSFSTVNFAVDNAKLSGDISLDPALVGMASIDVTLRNQAQIDGRFINVTSATIGGDSTWLMTGDSNVGALTLGAGGTVALGSGSSFNTLTVDEFTGNGGTLLFNTHLGDDSSATDKLIINGDANGQANVRVLNAGGAGAKTDRGIELIDIGGASNAQFDLVGRAVGGQYEYFLVKDANGNWYLRSELGGAPDPCLVDPTLPECKPIDPVDPVDPPPPILRPETGAYLANQFALDQMLRHQYRDRQGGAAAADGIRGWARVDATQSKLGAVDDQLDLRVDRSRLQLGADVGVFDDGRGRIGVMGTAARSSATSRSDVTGFNARGKVEGGALGVYGNWANDAMYVDASVQRGQFRNRVQGEGLAEERYDSDIWQSSLEAGYRFGIGQIGTTALSLQPELQLVYTDAKTDVHTEANGTVVRAAGNSGLSGRAGLRLQGEGHSAAGASVSPYLAANWYRDGAGNGIAFDDEVLRAGIPRNRYELSAGARVEFRSGFSAWGGFGVMRGDSGYREATANLSVAYKW
ncbi:autotransporter outer membrane beta-barrel domain-containing protein [Stenotrophomonas sp. 1337]|uniref:autotransporter family protein n=1 Tax=Stenotrophomonas sp. 1337 TaxID=2817757 RepID=UPI00285D95C2|nr:autotransporter outer membrane beta-barrel domain-containing protein [Stenotrophomonas sp. 1337]MDR6694922.1 autotransporter family porin [Stenotrophomonas sp. 1337]